jgi:hypothetical protein
MRSEHPQLFAQAAELEATLQERRSELGKDPVWLSYRGAVEGATLAELHEHEQLSLEDGGSCDGGYCMT